MIRKEYPMTVLRRWQFALLVGLLFAPLGMRAQTAHGRGSDRADGDSTVIATLYFSLNNGEWIEKTEYAKAGRLLRWAQTDTEAPIHITGWADRSGTADGNEQLSLRRARTVRNYLVSRGIAADRITIEGCGVDMQAVSDDKARRAEVRNVLFIAARQAVLSVEEKAGASAAEQNQPQPQQQPPPGKETPKQTVTEQTETVVTQPEQPVVAETTTGVETTAGTIGPGRYLAVKTNLAAWAGTILNVAADVQVGRHWSVELPVLWCPWYVSSKHAVKTFAIQPEGRYWLSKPGEGHFFGVHAHMGWFSVKWNRDRYQDTGRPLLGAGISYGYLLPFSEHWAGEFTLGAGYANMKYDTYYNIDNGARIDTRTKNYWGITRVGISVVYRFNLKK